MKKALYLVLLLLVVAPIQAQIDRSQQPKPGPAPKIQLDKPQEFFTIDKLRKSLGLDRRLTVPELLLHVFGHIEHIPSQRECLDEEFDKLDRALKPDDAIYGSAREVFEAYAVDDDFRETIFFCCERIGSRSISKSPAKK